MIIVVVALSLFVELEFLTTYVTGVQIIFLFRVCGLHVNFKVPYVFSTVATSLDGTFVHNSGVC